MFSSETLFGGPALLEIMNIADIIYIFPDFGDIQKCILYISILYMLFCTITTFGLQHN